MAYFLSKIKLLSISFALILTTCLVSSFSMAQATFLIWPIYPKIEANEKAVAIWLQNTGKTDAMVQVRVFKWNQNNFKDDYSEQNEVIPSPPVAKIKAGEKHMLRLTQAGLVPEGKEIAYRVIVDELPVNLQTEGESKASKVSFQMRYSIPLFVYGKGVGSGLTEESQKINAKNPLAKPMLSWYTQKNVQGKTELFLKNDGQKFARLSAIKTTQTGKEVALGKAAFGYILPNSTMKFEVEPGISRELLNSISIYGLDSSGVKQELIEIKKGGG
ncbi:fimbrial biogenesis chaperone [Acinetobacter sp. ESBL14]|uniref:fimbrial biogenesis chaperone n=1 Tax=Acinetobacter sp. ESBL14 TaxID=3077329 RepID=UPI002FC63CAE